jgi:molybdate transport system substrate-binding protein
MRKSLPTTIGSIAVVALVVAGCSSSKHTAAAPTSSAATPTAATPTAATSSAAATHTASSAPAASGLSGTAVVFAASSLKATFTTLATNFEQANPGTKIVLSLGGSDTLAAQITAGAPVDVFAAASTATMATVTNAHDGVGTPVVFAKNLLEIAVPPSNPAHIASLADTAKSGVKLALCEATAPCGAAAVKAYTAGSITAHPVTFEPDVASVLTQVELGEVDAGIVYQTDVKGAGAKVTGINFPEASSAINTYPIVVVTTGKNPTVGHAFAAYVTSAAGESVLQAAGFQQP